jgi:queuine tRNA-ribosyltransferase
MLGSRLNTIHNLYFYLQLMSRIRSAIEENSLDAFAQQFRQQQENSTVSVA